MFLNIKFLCLIPLVGSFLIAIIPKNIEFILNGDLKKCMIVSFNKISFNLIRFEFKLFDSLHFANSSIPFFFINNFIYSFNYLFLYYFELFFFNLQQQYYLFLRSSLKFLDILFYGKTGNQLYGQKSCAFIHQKIALIFSFVTFLYSLLFLYCFDMNLFTPQFETSFFNLCVLGVDGISIFFILLSTFLIFFCLFTGYSKNFEKTTANHSKVFLICFLFLDIFLVLVFSVLDFFYFYIFFELILIPMFFIIGFFGSRSRKIRAMYYFVIYTIVGSLCLLVGMFIYFDSISGYVALLLGDKSTNHISAEQFEFISTIYLKTPFLLFDQLSYDQQYFIWLLLFIGFAIKVPIIPFHLWLPEAHVEAPTAGSMLLAGILLKLGGYGFIRFLLPLSANIFFIVIPFVYTLALISIIYGGLTTLRQIDMKRIIAYSSIVHMNVGILGLFSNTVEGIVGSILLMLSHGIVSVGLFYIVGILYERFGSRLIEYYGGFVLIMPNMSFYFFLLVLGNTSFPGTFSFIGEIFNFVGVGQYSIVSLFFSVFFGMFLGTIYSFWLYNRIVFGEFKINYTLMQNNYLKSNTTNSFDLSNLEKMNLFILTFLMFLFGIFPSFFLYYLFDIVSFYVF